MIHPDTELRMIAPHRGYGVVVTRPIPRGTVTWVHDALDQVIDPVQLAALPEVLRKIVDVYGYVTANGNRVLCWDHARYVNHACEPAMVSVGMTHEIARRDLAPGDELTTEYARDVNLGSFACTCGAPSCRGARGPAEGAEQMHLWDLEASQAFAWALTVPQPLLAAARTRGAGARITEAILARRTIPLPSWADGIPESD